MKRTRWSTPLGLVIFAASIATIAFSVTALQEQDRQTRILQANAPATATAAALRFASPTLPPPSLTRTPLFVQTTPTLSLNLVTDGEVVTQATEVLAEMPRQTSLATTTSDFSLSPQTTLGQRSSLDAIASTPLLSVTAFPTAIPLEIADAAAERVSVHQPVANLQLLSLGQRLEVLTPSLSLPTQEVRYVGVMLWSALRLIFFPQSLSDPPAQSIRDSSQSETAAPSATFESLQTPMPTGSTFTFIGGQSGGSDNPPSMQPTAVSTNPPYINPPTALPPTNVLPTSVPPTAVPPTALPPTSIPPTAVPPTSVPSTRVPPTSVPPTDEPPTSQPPTNEPPTSEPPTDAPPTAEPPTNEPPTENPPEAQPTNAHRGHGQHRGQGSGG